MWGKARVFDIFWFVFLQKLGKLVRIWIKNEPIGETLVKSPNLALEKKVSKSEKYENVTFSSSNSVEIQNESTKWKIWATATTNFQYQPFFGQIGHLVHQKWHFFGQNLNFWVINPFDCSFMIGYSFGAEIYLTLNLLRVFSGSSKWIWRIWCPFRVEILPKKREKSFFFIFWCHLQKNYPESYKIIDWWRLYKLVKKKGPVN